MIRFCTLYSSSSGNCTYISDGITSVLIDVGVSASKIINSLKTIGVSPDDIDAILITHEHGDHICGIDVFEKKYGTPIYATEETLKRISGGRYQDVANVVTLDRSIDIGTAHVRAFKTPHDTYGSVGYTVTFGDVKLGFATDTGCVTKHMLSALAGCIAVVIEANHDVNKLMSGNYPYPLKQRILSDNGHLSNENCAWLATQLALWGTEYIALGHLSDSNNSPELAFEAVKNKLSENGFIAGENIFLCVADKSRITEIL